MKFKKISIILIIIMIFNLLQPICVEATDMSDVLNTFVYQYTTDELLDAMESAIREEIDKYKEAFTNEHRDEQTGEINLTPNEYEDMKNTILNSIILSFYNEYVQFLEYFHSGYLSGGFPATKNIEVKPFSGEEDINIWIALFGEEIGTNILNGEDFPGNWEEFEASSSQIINKIYREYNTIDLSTEVGKQELVPNSQSAESSNVILDILGVAVDGIFGLILYPIKLVFIIIAILANSIATGVANLGGNIEVDRFTLLTPDMILFNKVPLLDIDVFNVNGNDTEAIKTLRTSIVDWFYVLRNLSIIISLCVLIYIGIRMAISSLAENQAKYKKMFLNWVVGVLLIFVLQFIIVITITINNNIVSVLEPQEVDISGQMNALLGASFWPSLTVGFGSAIVYALLIGINFAFLIIYIKRMITISFLIVISPLITVTYAIDKVGDGRSQALNTWLKEFIYNVLIQPFHCIIYLIFATTAINLMNVDGLESIGAESLGSAVFAIILIAFLFKAEDILRKIFGFEEASTLGSGLGSAIALGAGLSTLSNFAGKKQQSGGRTNNVPPAALKAMMPQVQNQPNTTNAQTTAGSSSQTQTSTSTGGTGNSQNSGNTAANASSQNNAPSRGAKFAGQVLQFYKNNTLNIGAAMFGAAMGASQGSLSGIVGGATAGGMISKGSLDKLGAFRERKQVQRNEEIYENAYEKYKIAMLAKNPSLTDEDLRFNTKYLLNVDDTSKIQDDDAREYAIYAQGLRNTYTAIGIKDADKAVIDELNYIQKSKKK